jgi:hypothetical protein
MNACGWTTSSLSSSAGLRSILCGLLAAAVMLGSAGCSKNATYTYVDVHVSIDQQTISDTQLDSVFSCEFQVIGAEVSGSMNLPCRSNQVPRDVGTFQWTSNASTGDLQFRVRVFDGNLVVLGEGTSEAVAVAHGKHLQTSVLVTGVAGGTEPDGGSGDTSTTSDSGVDAGPDSSATGDGQVGGSTDAAIDSVGDSAAAAD